jgi:predicted alpha/beta hydrolase family esterase
VQHFILPGLNGSGADHWQSWWCLQIPTSQFIEQDDWERPRLDQWMARAIDRLERSQNALLIAHSLGCALVAHIARSRPDLPIAGALLVAPADVGDATWTPPEIAGFGPLPQTPLPFPSVVVASRNDPFVSLPRARQFAQGWHSKFVDIGHAGHINAASGFGPWPQGMAIAERLRHSAGQAQSAAREVA